MRCPKCGFHDTKVTDSRTTNNNRVRRKRLCTECDYKFVTFEQEEIKMPKVVKHDGAKVDFNREKLRKGIAKALANSPVEEAEIDGVVTRLQYKIQALGVKEINANDIGDLVIEELRRLDEVAYLRFASVYKRFQKLENFMDEIEAFVKKKSK